MASVVVTVVTSEGQLDLSMPDDRALRDIIPDLVYICTDSGKRSPTSQWAIGSINERDAFSPHRTLAECGVVDGQVLFLHDMAAGMPPPNREPAPENNLGPRRAVIPQIVGKSLQAPPSTNAKARFGWQPSKTGSYALAVILLGICALVYSRYPASEGGLAALAVIAVLLVAAVTLWWLGYFEVAGSAWHWDWAGHIPPPPGKNDLVPREPKLTATGQGSFGEIKIEHITALAENFINDLGRLLAGQNPDLSYMEPAVASSLRQLVILLHLSGDRIEPRFSSPQLTVTPDPANPIVFAEVRFDDHSVRVAANGVRHQEPERKVAIQLVLDRAASRVLRANLSAMAT